MGDIYRATDSMLSRTVAIKILAERYAQDDAVRERFTRESLAAARLSGQPNIVTILDAAHAKGVVHRDVKPANLMLDREGNVHVADFGIASAAGMDALTMTGTVLGTAGYLSPEQAQGEHATPASDRYSLAVVAFELLSGGRPFESESITAEAAAHVHAAVPSIAELCEGLPDELDPVFRRALAKDPAQRFETASEVVAALRAALADAAGATRSFRPTPTPAPPLSVLSPVTRRRAPRRRWPALAAL